MNVLNLMTHRRSFIPRTVIAAGWEYDTEHTADANTVFLIHCEDNAANTTVTDTQGDNQALNGANTSAVTDTGKFNLGFHTDRTAANCIICDASLKTSLDTTLGGDCTIEGWFKNDTTDWSVVGTQKICQFYDDGNNYGGMSYESGADTMYWEANFGGTVKNVTDSSVVDTDTWFHVALVFSESASTLKAFVNGTQVGATQTSCGTYAGGTVNFRLFTNHDATTQVWDGIVDEFAISNTLRYS